jgi:hypothetical protein
MSAREQKPAWMAQHPRLTVRLSGGDGDAYAIIGSIRRACTRAHWPPEDVKAATAWLSAAASYDDLLGRAMAAFEVE